MTTAFQSGSFQDDSFQIDAAAGGGSFAATETGSDTFSASGKVIVQGSLSVSETGSDSFSGSGKVIVKGTLSASESGSDTFAADGTVTGAGGAVSGSMSATESADVFGGYVYDYVVGDYVQEGVTGTVTGRVRRSAGGRRQYEIKGKRYWLTPQELEQLVAQMLGELNRNEVVDAENKIITRRAWSKIQASIKQAESRLGFKLPIETVIVEDEDDDEEALLMLI